MSSRQLRPKTEREKEWENQPFCLYDPMQCDRCSSSVFPPEKITCDLCLRNQIVESLDQKNLSWTMQALIGYKQFYEHGKVEMELKK